MSTNVSLTPELEEYAKSKVSEGLYNSVSEVMRDALRRLRKDDIEYIQSMHIELSRAEKEIDQGQITPLNVQSIIDEAEEESAKTTMS